MRALLAALLLGFCLNPIRRNHWRKRKGYDSRERYRKSNRQTELLEELADGFTHITDRHKYSHQAQGRCQNCQRQLLRRFLGRRKRRLPHLDMAENIFNYYNRIINQNADCQAQSHQRHIIQCKAHNLHHKEGGDNRRRNTQAADNSRTEIAQE